MINIDNINRINFVGESHKVDFIEILNNILRSKVIDVNLREIASHLLSATLGFCELDNLDDETIHAILTWSKEHHILTYK